MVWAVTPKTYAMARPTTSKYWGKYSIPNTITEIDITLPNTRYLLFSLARNPDINIAVVVLGMIAIDNKGIRSITSVYSGNTKGIISGATKIPNNARPIDAMYSYKDRSFRKNNYFRKYYEW